MPLNFLRTGRWWVSKARTRVRSSSVHVALATYGWGVVREIEEGREESRAEHRTILYAMARVTKLFMIMR